MRHSSSIPFLSSFLRLCSQTHIERESLRLLGSSRAPGLAEFLFFCEYKSWSEPGAVPSDRQHAQNRQQMLVFFFFVNPKPNYTWRSPTGLAEKNPNKLTWFMDSSRHRRVLKQQDAVFSDAPPPQPQESRQGCYLSGKGDAFGAFPWQGCTLGVSTSPVGSWILTGEWNEERGIQQTCRRGPDRFI